jgi:hypothetical protein
MKNPILFLVLFFLLIFQCIHANTIQTSSCDQNEVQKAINDANAGDTILVQAGNCIWAAQTQGCIQSVGPINTMLCIKKGISLHGGIGGTTTITFANALDRGGILYLPDTQSIANDTPFEFSGFTLDANKLSFLSGVITIANDGITPLTKIKIHHNIFKNSLSQTIQLIGPIYGVAYSNTFLDCLWVIREDGGDYRSWNLNQREYGTANNFYFEDNSISTTTVQSTGAFSAGQGGSIVIRYNTYDLGNLLLSSNQWNDLHGLQSMAIAPGFDCSIPGGCGYDGCLPTKIGSCDETVRKCEQWSQVKTEWYGNIANNFRNVYVDPQEWIHLRGSWMIMFNNTIHGTGVMPRPIIFEYACDSCQSPATPAYSQHVQNTYVWNNLGNGTNRPIIVGEDICGKYTIGKPYSITENSDFWNYNQNTLDGNAQKGINCGSSMPASNCSVGDGYWQADYSPCSSLPNTMSEIKTVTQTGKFYKCTAPNTWTLYYKPYTYPHPLRNETTLPPICATYSTERYSTEQIWIEVTKWTSGQITLSEIIRKTKLWKYCN